MTNSRNADHSPEIMWQTVENMNKIGNSIESLYGTLESEFRRSGYFHIVTHLSSEDTLVDSQWCYDSECRVYELTKTFKGRRGRKPILGAVTVRIELWRDVSSDNSIKWEYRKTPLIYVGFSPKDYGYWSQNDLYLDQYGHPMRSDDFKICSSEDIPWLWECMGVNDSDDPNSCTWSEYSWFFVVPLCAIENRKDVKLNIINPIRKLLIDGSSPCEAFDETNAIRFA